MYSEGQNPVLSQDGIAISADVRQWEHQEAARKAAALEKVMQFKAMRESQVKDKEERLRKVRPRLLPSPSNGYSFTMCRKIDT